jgi:hypothetical protein
MNEIFQVPIKYVENLMHNLWGLVQSENVGPLVQILRISKSQHQNIKPNQDSLRTGPCIYLGEGAKGK